MQQRQAFQLGRLDLRFAVEQCGAAHRYDFFAEQVFGQCPWPHRITKVYRRVKGGVGEHEGFGPGGQIQGDRWMQRMKATQPRNQPTRRKRRNDGQFEHPTGPAMRHQRQGVVLDPFQAFSDLFGVKLSGFRERDALLDAIEQLNTQIVFKRRDLSTDRTLRQRKLFRRAGEALVTCRRLKSDQKFRARDFSSHRVDSKLE